MKIALTIAGSDPTGGAGIQQDLKVFHHFGVYGLSVVSALTAQNTFEFNASSGVSEELLLLQLNTLLSDIRPGSLKTGMLYSVNAVRSVAKAVKGFELDNLVIDPVTISSTGAVLVEEGTLDALKTELFPLARVITPNISEASVITGIKIENEGDMERAACELHLMGPETVIITGGHIEKETMDLIFDGKKFHRIRGRKIKGEFHGTGCAYSAAITALLARGISVVKAAGKAKEFMDLAIKNALDIGKGMKLLRGV